MLNEVFGNNAMSLDVLFNCTNDFLNVGKKLKMMNVPVPVTARTEG